MVRGYIPAPCPIDMVYAPIDLAVEISENLTKKGHEVTYFGPNDTHISAKVETCNLRPLVRNQKEFRELIENPDLSLHHVPGLWDRFLAKIMFERAKTGEYDLLHFHHPESALDLAHLYPEVPIVYTLHDPLNLWYREVLEMYPTSNQFFISISNNQRIPAPNLSFSATVYNGIDTELFPCEEEREDYLLFVGRITPEKGTKEAIQVAKETGHRLLIIGPLYKEDQEYFDQSVKPYLDDKILYLNFIERKQLARYYKKAKAFLMPIQWEEPFGLSMVEAMACGTPVIAMRRGSVAEVVVDGETGYIVNTVAEMAEAVNKVDAIKSINCRQHVEKNFSTEKMTNGYENAFEKILQDFKARISHNSPAPPTAVVTGLDPRL